MFRHNQDRLLRDYSLIASTKETITSTAKLNNIPPQKKRIHKSLARAGRKAAKRILKETFDPLEVITHLPKVLIELNFASSEATTRIRREYNRNLRTCFTSCAREILFAQWKNVISKRRLIAAVKNYDIHHKVPVAFGGNNDFDNLILIDKKLHAAIHRYIHRKIKEIQQVQKHQRTRKKSKYSQKNYEDDLRKIEGIFLGKEGQIYFAIPMPEGTTCIPQIFLQSLGAARFSPNRQNVTLADVWPKPALTKK